MYNLFYVFFPAIHPNLDSYVFLRVDEDVEGVNTEEEADDARLILFPSSIFYFIPFISML